MSRLRMLGHGAVIAAFFAAAVFASPSRGGEIQAYPVPVASPALELEDLGGRRHTLSEYRGRVVLLNFWASWCTPCVLEMPSIQRLKQRLAGRAFEVLAVSVDESRQKVWKFVRLIDFRQIVLLDPHRDAFIAWEGQVLPTTFLIDAAGSVRYRVLGPLEWDRDDIVSLVDGLAVETATAPHDGRGAVLAQRPPHATAVQQAPARKP